MSQTIELPEFPAFVTFFFLVVKKIITKISFTHENNLGEAEKFDFLAYEEISNPESRNVHFYCLNFWLGAGIFGGASWIWCCKLKEYLRGLKSMTASLKHLN